MELGHDPPKTPSVFPAKVERSYSVCAHTVRTPSGPFDFNNAVKSAHMRQKAQRRLSHPLSLIVRGPGGAQTKPRHRAKKPCIASLGTALSSSKYFVPAKGMFCCEIAKDGTIAESPASDQGGMESSRELYLHQGVGNLPLPCLHRVAPDSKQPMDPSRSSARTFSQPSAVPSEARNAMPATKVCAAPFTSVRTLYPCTLTLLVRPGTFFFEQLSLWETRQCAHTPWALYGAHTELPNLLSVSGTSNSNATPDCAEPGLGGAGGRKKE